ncbi:MAG: hypothetical protein HYS14_05770 [Candidatus Rokubacteria bacterium]|nr:hypothetical protein [Candidatus Rokubacteria bacterium]
MNIAARVTWTAMLALLLFVPADLAFGYANGPVRNVTDLSPTCASCHSSMQKEQLKELPPQVADQHMVENRHYKAIEAGDGPYKDMKPEDRARLLQDVKAMDAAAAVVLVSPTSARPGQEITATVTAKGGSGPVVGIFLVDALSRYQSRTVASDGWLIVGAPKVWGPDGKEQTRWVDQRAEGFKKNLNFAVVYGVKSDLEKKAFPESKAAWTLRAPQAPGTYTLVAAFHYGTEKASPVGSVERAGATLPRGGGGGPSGHILFSQPITVTVR